MEEHRSTWQMWHVRAEAQRQVRTADIPAHRSDALVDLLVDEVLHSRSVPLAPPDDGIREPEMLRRVDGASVYTVAGAQPYTSRRILDAEQRLVAIAGRRDGAVVDESAVDLALLEMAANRTALDAGQEALVRQMCISGARLQLAIAPAGAGKTTAMRALTAAWTQTAARSSVSPRPPRRPPSSANRPASPPTRWPSSPGPSSTASYPTGQPGSADPPW